MKPVSKQRIGKHVSAATNTNATTEVRCLLYGPCRDVLSSPLSLMNRRPCGGGVEYLHRSSASRRRRRKWNPLPGGITGPPSPWGILNARAWPFRLRKYESETVKYGYESRVTRYWEWLRWQGPTVIVKERPIFSSERMLHKDYDLKGTIAGSESQGACRQD
jgi:hypothetical protein